MKFFDAHTHVQFSAYAADRDDVIRRSLAEGVWMMNVGTQQDTSRVAVELAEKYPEGVYAAIGLHPVHTGRSFHDEAELGGGEAAKGFTSRGEVFDPAYYRELAEHPKTLAIGECGLDYFRFDEHEPREAQVKRQKDAFLAQIALAKETGKPIMIHCREAFADVIEIVRGHAADMKPGIVHFFTGTPADAQVFTDMGFYFTFGGAITFPPRKGMSEGAYDAVIRQIPTERILTETDAPYVSPVSHRGKRNEPSYIPEIVAKLAELKGIPPDEMKAHIFANAKRVLQF